MATAGRLLNDFEVQQPSTLAVQDSIYPLLPDRTEVPVTWRSFQQQDEELSRDPVRSGVPEPGLEPMYGDELLMLAPAMSIGRTMIDDIGALAPRLLANSVSRGGAARTAGEVLMSTPVGRTAMRRFAETPIGRETAARIYSGIPVVEQQGMLRAGEQQVGSTVADVLSKTPKPYADPKMIMPPQYNEMVRYGVDPSIAARTWRNWDRSVDTSLRNNTMRAGVFDLTIPEYTPPNNEWIDRAELGLRGRFDYEGKNPMIGTASRAIAAYDPIFKEIEYSAAGVFNPVEDYRNTYRHELGHHIATGDPTRDVHGLTTEDYIRAILPNEMPDEFIRRPEIGRLSHSEALVEYWKDQGLIDDTMYNHIQNEYIPQRWDAQAIRDELPSTIAEADTIPYAIGRSLIELSAPLTVENVLNNIRVGKDRLWLGEAKLPELGKSENGWRRAALTREAEHAKEPVMFLDETSSIPETAQGFLDRQRRLAGWQIAEQIQKNPSMFENK